jgi:hypothetical protein
MAKPQPLRQEIQPLTDRAVSRFVQIPPWQNFVVLADLDTQFARDFRELAAKSREVVRYKVRKPGNDNNVDPGRLCEILSPKEDFNFQDRMPDRFGSGIGKNYDGYRIAFVEDEGFYRIENDGKEIPATPTEVFRFRADLSEAAKTDDEIRKYTSEKKIL